MSWFGVENAWKRSVALLGGAYGMADKDLTNVVSTRKGQEILKSSPMNKAGITAKGVGMHV